MREDSKIGRLVQCGRIRSRNLCSSLLSLKRTDRSTGKAEGRGIGGWGHSQQRPTVVAVERNKPTALAVAWLVLW